LPRLGAGATLRSCTEPILSSPISFATVGGSEPMRAGDHDRELVAKILREQHLTGRLDSRELEQRLESCLVAKSYAELRAITADLPAGGGRPWVPLGLEPSPMVDPCESATVRRVRHVLRELAALISILLLAIWAVTSRGYFWPAWAWFGLGVPLGLDASLCWAWRGSAGRVRRARGLWTTFGFLEAAFIVVWLLTAIEGPRTYFWPIWPLLGFVGVAGTYTVIALGAPAAGSRGGSTR
jgi:Domain of unknown function (DUF1707)